jgi:hypothetical protein
LIALCPAPARRARRHPLTILALYAYQSALALCAALPAASLARAAYGNDPRGDAALWAPGGRALLDFLWHEQHGLGAAWSTAEGVLVVAFVAGLVPTAATFVAIAFETSSGRRLGFARSVAEALRIFPAMLALLVVAASLLALLALGGFAASDVVEAWCHEAWGEAAAEKVAAAAVAPLVLAASVVGVVEDMARAAVVRFGVGAWRGLALGVAAFMRAPVALWWSWAWRWLASLAPVAGVALVETGARVGPVLILALLHQAAILARVAIRVSWWATALRDIDADAPSPEATPATPG